MIDHTFRELEHAGWERVADRYDSVWATITRQFVPALLDAGKLHTGMRLLDVCCGPGYVAAIAYARGVSVIGVDFSKQMVDIARRLNPEIDFLVCDAEKLDFADQSFDRVVMNFGLLHLADPHTALREARRVLRPDGRVVFTVWAEADTCVGSRIMGGAIERFADTNVPLPPAPPYYQFCELDTCAEALESAGFDPTTMTFETVVVSWLIPTARYLFDAERHDGVRTAALLALQSEERLDEIRSAVEHEMQPLAVSGGYSLPMAAIVIAADAR